MNLQTNLTFAAVLGLMFSAFVMSTPIELLRMRMRQLGSDDDNDAGSQPFESFDRRSGVPFPMGASVRGTPLAPVVGRNFGQYGSYKQQRYWQRAVFEDKRRHALAFGTLTAPNFGYAIGNFWNSYATGPDSQNSD